MSDVRFEQEGSSEEHAAAEGTVGGLCSQEKIALDRRLSRIIHELEAKLVMYGFLFLSLSI